MDTVAMSRTDMLFDKLLPELRNHIYELVVMSEVPIDVTTEKQPGIAVACRQARRECLQMYFTRNTFSFTTISSDDDALDMLVDWMKRIGRVNAGFLANMEVTIGKDQEILIKGSRGEDNPWLTLADTIVQLGCSERIWLNIKPSTPSPPSSSHLARTVRVVGSLKAVEDDIARGQKNSRIAMSSYINLLLYQKQFKASNPGSSTKANDLLQGMLDAHQATCLAMDHLMHMRIKSIASSAKDAAIKLGKMPTSREIEEGLGKPAANKTDLIIRLAHEAVGGVS